MNNFAQRCANLLRGGIGPRFDETDAAPHQHREYDMATVIEDIFKPKVKKAEAGTVHWLDEQVKRSKREVFSEVVTVTPGLANVILGNNEHNRNVRAVKLAQFAADMKGGRWSFNGEPIIIANTGELNDGQHRLHAVIEANISMPFLFVFGVDRETRTTVDQGSARTAADYLGMRGVVNSALSAGIARLVIAYERSGGQDVAGTKFVTNADVLARIDSDDGIEKSATFAQRHIKSVRPFCAPSPIGACHYLLNREHPADADLFIEQVCLGENLRKSDPAFAVRERLLTSGKYAGQKMEIIFRGWNAFRSNRPLKIAKVLGSFPALF